MTPGAKKLLTNGGRTLVTVAALWLVFSKISISDTVTTRDGTVYTGELRVRAYGELPEADRASLQERYAEEPPSDGDPITIIVVKDAELTRHLFPENQIAVDPDDPSGARRLVDLGVVSLFKQLDFRWFIAAAALYPLALLIGAFRWGELMRVHDIRPGGAQTVRLTWIGFFWSLVFPGVTGGDLVKMYYVCQQTPKKTTAVITVLLDRVAGLVGMALVSGGAIIIVLAQFPGHRELQTASHIIGIFIALAFTGALVFFSHRLRGLVRIDWLISKLPFNRIVTEIDRAVFAYRDHKGTVAGALGLSLTVDVITVFTFVLVGQALHIDVMVWHYFVFVPVILMVSSIPVTLAGLGLMEAMSQKFFMLPGVGATAGQALALIILFRAVTVIAAVPGALLSLTGVAPSEQMARELEESQEERKDEGRRTKDEKEGREGQAETPVG